MTRLKQNIFRERLYRRRFFVPNAVTVGNMFCGFLAIMYSFAGRYQDAVIAIGIAIVLDGLDGRVARKLNATSQFGLEFDSLSDVISFGVAPAILAYNWGFKSTADEFGILICFLYLLCAATRLARFNAEDNSESGFRGLPTPGAAGGVVALVNLIPHQQGGSTVVPLLSVYLALLGFLMISTFSFASIKTLRFRDMTAFGRVFVGALIVFLWYRPRIQLATLAFGYILSGPVLWIFSKKKRIKRKEEIRSDKSDDDLSQTG